MTEPRILSVTFKCDRCGLITQDDWGAARAHYESCERQA